jgi:hypothetical protein
MFFEQKKNRFLTAKTAKNRFQMSSFGYQATPRVSSADFESEVEGRNQTGHKKHKERSLKFIENKGPMSKRSATKPECI